MAYKMKGPSLYKDKLTVNRNGYDNKPEGRAKSSMAQKEVHSMFYQNKPGAPDMKTGKYEHSFEKGGAPKKGETDAEFEERMRKQGMTIKPTVEVKKSENLTKRDALAKDVEKGKSGTIKKGMEQSAKSSNYKKADEILAKEGDKEAKRRLRKRAIRSKEVKEIYEKNPDMTQAEVDKLMSER